MLSFSPFFFLFWSQRWLTHALGLCIWHPQHINKNFESNLSHWERTLFSVFFYASWEDNLPPLIPDSKARNLGFIESPQSEQVKHASKQTPLHVVLCSSMLEHVCDRVMSAPLQVYTPTCTHRALQRPGRNHQGQDIARLCTFCWIKPQLSLISIYSYSIEMGQPHFPQWILITNISCALDTMWPGDTWTPCDLEIHACNE